MSEDGWAAYVGVSPENGDITIAVEDIFHKASVVDLTATEARALAAALSRAAEDSQRIQVMLDAKRATQAARERR